MSYLSGRANSRGVNSIFQDFRNGLAVGLACLPLVGAAAPAMATGTGVVAAWGNNSNGQLGNNSTTNSSVPVAVMASGALSSKTVVQVSGGQSHACALTSEAWLPRASSAPFAAVSPR